MYLLAGEEIWLRGMTLRPTGAHRGRGERTRAHTAAVGSCIQHDLADIAQLGGTKTVPFFLLVARAKFMSLATKGALTQKKGKGESWRAGTVS